MTDWRDAQTAEADSWLIEDEVKRNEKIEREVIRYPKMMKEMGLNLIDLSNKKVVDVGGGPIGMVADLKCKEKVVVDPLSDSYKKYFDCPFHIQAKGEYLPFESNSIDVVIITNALDHCESPEMVLWEAKRVLRPGGFLAIHNAINLASIHPHPGHRLNLNEDWFHDQIDGDFETVHEMNFKNNGLRYGWVKYRGKVGQPAWAGLYRKITGYSNPEKGHNEKEENPGNEGEGVENAEGVESGNGGSGNAFARGIRRIPYRFETGNIDRDANNQV